MTVPPVDPSTAEPPQPATPEPVIKAAAIWGTLATLITTVVGVLVALGWLSAEQGSALNGVVSTIGSNIVPVGVAIVGIVGVVSGIASHLVTAFVARRQVTPVVKAPRR